MNEHFEPDPLDALRAADPVRADHLPSASLARIRARVREDVMTSTTSKAAGPARLISAGVAVAAAAALALVVLNGGNGGNGLVPATSSGPGSAACVDQYTTATLVNRTFAFDGTVIAIDGERVTFEVNATFKGVSGETMTLDAPSMTGTAITSAGGPNLSIGERYLVAGDDTFVWACGFTQPYADAVAAEWAAAFGG